MMRDFDDYDADATAELERLRRRVAELRRIAATAGICPDCGTVPVMDDDGPFSHCACGTAEDYGEREVQALELRARRAEIDLERLTRFRGTTA